MARRLYRGRNGTQRRSDLAYGRALYALRKAFPNEYELITVSVDEEEEPGKAAYERLAVLRHLYPKTFGELLGDEREALGLPRGRQTVSVAERRRAKFGVEDRPRE